MVRGIRGAWEAAAVVIAISWCADGLAVNSKITGEISGNAQLLLSNPPPQLKCPQGEDLAEAQPEHAEMEGMVVKSGPLLVLVVVAILVVAQFARASAVHALQPKLQHRDSDELLKFRSFLDWMHLLRGCLK
eukprot:CAMPEP_0169209770 /NCGR_PEP_ID=MMETSP1016-20121227/14848_1 /TAXON_ID=342587 /ORGANISM="Karlodinium micrum, Strain CCMP2283" /LENGTH=131 /DNA_ID=CAMNT_0009287245 /DNA_START=61 /DNA_END=457 /DNA_ORIENTATION=-